VSRLYLSGNVKLQYIASKRIKHLVHEGKASDAQPMAEHASVPSTIFSKSVVQHNVEPTTSFQEVTRQLIQKQQKVGCV